MCALLPTCCEPSNIMCSKRCANPVLPAFSLAGPTWYQMLTETSGSVRSSERITSSPFFNLYFSKGMVGSFREGDCASAGWTAATTDTNSRLPERRMFPRDMNFLHKDGQRVDCPLPFHSERSKTPDCSRRF